MTWTPGGRSGSFIGEMFRPLGAAMAMVQVPFERPGTRDGIGLFGIAAEIDPQQAVVSYGDARLRHDFHRVAKVGARGPVLDPTSEQAGSKGKGKGKGTWVELALTVDKLRARAAACHWRLPTVPTLPEIYYGYGRPDQAPFQETAALRRLAIAALPVTWSSDSLGALDKSRQQAMVDRERAFAEMSADAQREQLMAAWRSAFIPPTDASNSTGIWLLPFELSGDVYGAVRVFECFRGLTGAFVFNPARKLAGKTVRNPAAALAAEHGIDLAGELAKLAHTAHGSPEDVAMEQRIIQLIPAYRERLRASSESAIRTS